MNNKQAIADHLLDNGSLFVHLDPRRADVVVPPWLRHQAQLVLQYGHNMPIPIDDLRTDAQYIVGTLSFSRTPFRCVVPWSAVFALVGDSGRGQVWTEDTPAEIVAEMVREQERTKRGDGSGVRFVGAPRKFEYVKGGALLSTPARGVLRRVK